MKHNTIQPRNSKHRLVRILQATFMLTAMLLAVPASAQITIGGNVYGGGNKGNMTNTEKTTESLSNVTIKGGSITGKVFGGARMAGVNGGTHVKLDGEKASADIIIGEVYGGNDIAGTVSGTALVESTYRADVAEATQNARIYVTNLYGGGNGDYDYTSEQVQKTDAEGNKLYIQEDGTTEGTTVTGNPLMVVNPYKDKVRPEIANTEIKLLSGCYSQVFAGGNSATVTASAKITLDNSTTRLLDATGGNLDYQFDRVFGGNNQVPMAIRPTWELTKASINNLYSGGNAGAMTYANGILLAITGDGMTINNVYGGCRMADVNPDKHTISSETIEGVSFRGGYSARTLILGGKINNVYGGNDISGNVYGGSALEIRSSILGDVYGGGNGSYAYTDNASLKDDPTYGDYYYEVPEGNTSAQALYKFRPNAESVWIHVAGQAPADENSEPTITYIGGSLYCGGNSATLTGSENNSAQLRIGSYVIADKVFLGSNGENMVSDATLSQYAGNVSVDGQEYDFSQMDLTKSTDFEQYMKGVEVGIKPSVNFDTDYRSYSTKFGSLYCGGNIGSMSAEGLFTISFLNSLVIFDKIVGGCNNANVAYKEGVNAFHMGGLTNTAGVGNPKVVLNISGVKLEPRKLVPVTDGSAPFELAWNTDVINGKTILKGANIYGGCYSSGYVNGRVEINVTADAISENVFAEEGGSGADFATLRDNPLVSTMSVYGGGYGQETEIWGNVAVNITNNAHILKVYGGGEEGIVGKMNRVDGVQQTTAENAYGTTVTLNATTPTATNGFTALNAAKIYGGGFKGLVTGKTHVDLDKGSVYSAFAGACNADIWGGTEIYVGKSSVPTVYNNIYGGNDFGGQISGSLQHNALYSLARYKKVRSNTYVEYYDANIGTKDNDGAFTSGGNIFGGPCGSYDYSLYETTNGGTTTTDYISKPTLSTDVSKEQDDDYAANSFVNIVANNYTNTVSSIYGGGQGLAGTMGYADMNSSYVLLHSTAGSVILLADNVFGAGDCSTTKYSLVDAYRGQFGTIFGGCRGVSLAEKIHQYNVATLTYMGDLSEVNLFAGMTNKQMDVYGAGAYSGSKESKVTLNGGYANNVYGSSFNQGITYLATVEVPSTSTAHVNAIFGGGKGEATLYPCDTYTSFINYNSATASVETAIYGGNNQFRITRFPHININVPVKDAEGDLKDVYGAGYGENTIAQYTKVNLNANSKVNNVFGGGRDGVVYNMPSVIAYLKANDYFGKNGTTAETILKAYAYTDIEIKGYVDWHANHGEVNGETIYALDAKPDGNITNTRVNIPTGALVANNAYGGGEGSKATVSGTTGIDLVGGTVTADLYGGGLGGNVAAITGVTTTASTSVRIQGGKARNVYGGGLNGNVEGNTNTVLGTLNQSDPVFENGLPTVERSLYGGGEKGYVHGTANLTINNGFVGYKYDPETTLDDAIYTQYQEQIDNAETEEIRTNLENELALLIRNAPFLPNVDYLETDDNLLIENGNAFGGGYGEGASVDKTIVTLYDGIIRNGLYGGGEIAAIGRGTASNPKADLAGETHVYMYNGHVVGDVFGGGRGFSYDLNGNEIIGSSLSSDGYVFGSTDVNIRGGEVGTDENVKEGHGNVFGGGNLGYVYSVNGTKATEDSGKITKGRYYTSDGNMTEDVRVIVSPWAQVTASEGITISTYDEKNETLVEHHYDVNDYVPTDALNTLRDKHTDEDEWAKVSLDGVIIHNAVFAGGNISSGSDKIYANTTTVFGNSSATVNDVFNRDLITLGTDHIGGLYGDGNLTFVDGFRELNITNYGTDYYEQDDFITLPKYRSLNDRERAYFKLEYQNDENIGEYTYYKCTAPGTYGGIIYVMGQHILSDVYETLSAEEKANFSETTFPATTAESKKISEEEYKLLSATEQGYWTPYGFCSIYAGRIMNTIQRADFCGVFGSRLVLQGAMDRVPEAIDYTNYTINRLGELSLNKRDFHGNKSDLSEEKIAKMTHGNYFGMYNIVNYLGAITSDVEFTSTRTYDNANGELYAPKGEDDKTYYDWKVKNKNNKTRNNGTCHNTVALASGVYLELVEEKGSTESEKKYGKITGVVELNLINVIAGLGGGYVYAKNEHGLRTGSNGIHDNLSSYNKNAVNNSAWIYDEDEIQAVQTSGNFIHKTTQIVDDCFPTGGNLSSAAHYWYIKGEVYVYDQYISAYTGSATAYPVDMDLPLTITAGANGKIDLLDIKPNRYAYYSDEGGTTQIGEEEKIVVNNLTYKLNDIISYWDYMQLTDEQKNHFVEDTYVSVVDFAESQDGTIIPAGKVYLPSEYSTYASKHSTVWNPTLEQMVPVQDVIHISNSISHGKGYLLTVELTNPTAFDKWYSPNSGAGKISREDYKGLGDNTRYIAGPTYYTDKSGIYGQMYYHKDDVISGSAVSKYTAFTPADLEALKEDRTQATIDKAYVALTETVIETTDENNNTVSKTLQKGVGISATLYNSLDAASKAKFDEAYTCTSTYTVDKTLNEYIYFAELISDSKRNELYEQLVLKNKENGMSDADAATDAESTLQDHFDIAYIATSEGYYGGQNFVAGQNYRALDTWASLSDEDRKYFNYRYDALDVLVEPTYPGTGEAGGMYLYDGKYWNGADGNTTWPKKQVYGISQSIDYTAIYEGTESLVYTDAGGNQQTIANGKTLTRSQYEGLPHEQRNYVGFQANVGTTYIVKESFNSGGTSYAVGNTFDESIYNSLDSERKQKIVTFTVEEGSAGKYYFCRNSYKVGENGEGQTVKDVNNKNKEYASSNTVPVGVIITEDNFGHLTNRQVGFSIHTTPPVETSTLYVSNASDYYDLTKDRIITLIYKYTYEESDESGQNVEEISEKHIVNIHVQFKSGVPTVGQLQEPSAVLPGQTIGLRQPKVTEGAYTILGGGWELYTNPDDAQKHQNGLEYVNNSTRMYWYQDNYYIAYYSKTYLGRTYSNSVPMHVANYHDIAEVMSDPDYMYIDNSNVKRAPKIYIDNSTLKANPEASATELDMLSSLFQKSLATSTKTVQVDVQDVDKVTVDGQEVEKPVYWKVDDKGNKLNERTYDVTPYPVTHKENRTVPILGNNVRNCQNLDFFLSDDMTTKSSSWTPIGGVDASGNIVCFSGNVHGNGHTISGLDKSLFASLCGNVYNLGVTGTFKTSGIADAGDGWVENCWTFTSEEPDAGTRPVFAYNTNDGRTHMRNTYYPVKSNYVENGVAKAMPEKSFYNGEVAYNLNGFYLNKRYYDMEVPSGGVEYKYWTINSDDNTKLDLHTSKYATTDYYYPETGTNRAQLNYVERYYADGDYIYAGGTIPETVNERWNNANGTYYPIYPDDYIFFGQMLTYGYVAGDNYVYQNKPSYVYKTDKNRLLTTDRSNRVFRAPAYFMSKTMDKAHFNYLAVLADKSSDDNELYPTMTAIDFTANGDKSAVSGWDGTCFYPPFLDYDGLKGYQSSGLTQNLLVYADKVKDPASYEVLDDYLFEPEIVQDDKYNTVSIVNSDNVRGHLVDLNNGVYVASHNHLLVDRQDFNAPIGYQFGDGNYMWYQRTPDVFANGNAGWETICLPFTADLVATQQKGEITHFYGSSKDNAVGHEYWLRGLTSVSTADNKTTASFIRPMYGTMTNKVSNSFLYDYYYSKNSGYDKNEDIYQQYWNNTREYENYPFYTGAVPYIIAFPGQTFYEFDMSGNFVPANTYLDIDKLDKQVVSFVSSDNQLIAVSDDENRSTTTENGYTYKGYYQADALTTGSYMLDDTGAQFNATTDAAPVTAVPFRAYFMPKQQGGSVKAETIFIGPDADYIDDPDDNRYDGTIQVYGMNDQLHIVSYMDEDTLVPVYNLSGQLIKNVQLRARAHEKLRVPSGIYVAHGKKAAVR